MVQDFLKSGSLELMIDWLLELHIALHHPWDCWNIIISIFFISFDLIKSLIYFLLLVSLSLSLRSYVLLPSVLLHACYFNNRRWLLVSAHISSGRKELSLISLLLASKTTACIFSWDSPTSALDLRLLSEALDQILLGEYLKCPLSGT